MITRGFQVEITKKKRGHEKKKKGLTMKTSFLDPFYISFFHS